MKALLFPLCVAASVLAMQAHAGKLEIVGEAAKPAARAADVAPATSVVPAAPVVVTASTTRTWRVESSDVRLSTTLERWSKEAGHNLIWDAEKQVLLSAKDSYVGNLEDAITRVLTSPAIRRSEYPLEACFYPNSPPVIRITRLGEQAEECPK